MGEYHKLYFVWLQVAFESVCSEVISKADMMMQEASCFMPCLPPTDSRVKRAEAVIELEYQLRNTRDRVMQASHYLQAAYSAYELPFRSDAELKRFTVLLEQLKVGVIQPHMNEALMLAAKDVDSMMKNAMLLVYDTSEPPAEVQRVFNGLKDSIGNCIVRHIIQCLKQKPLFVPSNFHLVEDRDISEKRSQCNKDSKMLADAAKALNKIEKSLKPSNGERKSSSSAAAPHSP